MSDVELTNHNLHALAEKVGAKWEPYPPETFLMFGQQMFGQTLHVGGRILFASGWVASIRADLCEMATWDDNDEMAKMEIHKTYTFDEVAAIVEGLGSKEKA